MTRCLSPSGAPLELVASGAPVIQRGAEGKAVGVVGVVGAVECVGVVGVVEVVGGDRKSHGMVLSQKQVDFVSIERSTKSALQIQGEFCDRDQ